MTKIHTFQLNKIEWHYSFGLLQYVSRRFSSIFIYVPYVAYF